MDPTAPDNKQGENTTVETEVSTVTPSVNETQPEPELNTAGEQSSVQNEADTILNQTQSNQNISNQAHTESVTTNTETSQATDTHYPQQEMPPLQNSATDPSQVITTQTQTAQEEITEGSGRKSRKPLILLLLLVFGLIFLTGLGGLTYAVAYEKIKLEKYPDLQKKVSYFIMELPFMPKTPKFLLAKSGLAHQDITKQSFDLSVAVDSADLTGSLGLSALDIQVKGAFDYSDPKNVFGNFDLSVTKDFNIELRKKDEMLYFRLNKLPAFLFAFLGISTANFDPILAKWVAYDTTPLDTEARKSIQQDQEVDPLSEEFIDKNFEKYLDEEILSKMQLSSDTEEGHSVHKITLDADSNLIDHLGKKLEEESRQKANYAYPQSTDDNEKLSDFIKKLKWEMYIDKESYYMRKVIVSIDLEYDSSDGLGTFSMGSMINPLSQKNSAKIALAAKFNKFGEEVVVEIPEESITFEEFTELLSASFNEIYGTALVSPESQFAQARDAKRKSDLMALRSALELYRSDCSRYPSTLSDMTHTAGSENCQYQSGTGVYIMTIPSDPEGTNYFYQTSENGNSYSLCANLEIAETVAVTCPDPSFNYHVPNP